MTRMRGRGQVVRLAVLFFLAGLVLLIARARLVPATFGDLGHYRAESLAINAEQPLRYAGLQVCAQCHTDDAETVGGSYHRGLTCEGCHGPANQHAEDPTEARPAVPRGREVCLRCHEYRFSRPTGFPQIIETTHNPLAPCSSCHDPHDPTPPHMPEACSACHAAIERTKAVSHHQSVECETCHEAPAEHRVSPRSYLPSKPREREFCGRCHGEKADSPTSIPRVDLAEHGGRYLCWQCHYPHFPEG